MRRKSTFREWHQVKKRRNLNVAVSIICFIFTLRAFMLLLLLLRELMLLLLLLLFLHELPKVYHYSAIKSGIYIRWIVNKKSPTPTTIDLCMWIRQICARTLIFFLVASINCMPTLKLNQMLIITTGDLTIFADCSIVTLTVAFYIWNGYNSVLSTKKIETLLKFKSHDAQHHHYVILCLIFLLTDCYSLKFTVNVLREREWTNWWQQFSTHTLDKNNVRFLNKKQKEETCHLFFSISIWCLQRQFIYNNFVMLCVFTNIYLSVHLNFCF